MKSNIIPTEISRGVIMENWTTLADKVTLEKTMESLKNNGISSYYVQTGEAAKQKLLELLPEGSEVMNNSSTTLIQIGADKAINESGKYISVRNMLMKMDRNTQNREMQRMGAAPEYSIGSVHAVTQTGELMWASASGSQIPGYAFGADKVVLVVGTHKIVKDLNKGFERIYKHCLPLENERAMKAYGAPSAVNKLFVINKDRPTRTHLIFVNEALGF